jgi:hypothetical protein
MFKIKAISKITEQELSPSFESQEKLDAYLTKHLGRSFDTYELLENTDEMKVKKLDELSSYALSRMELGKKCLGLFIGLIHKRMYPDEQREELLRNATVIRCIQHFQFGKLTEAKELIQTIEADDYLFFQEDLDDVVFYIDQKTGI